MGRRVRGGRVYPSGRDHGFGWESHDLRWWWTAVLNIWREESDWRECVNWFQRQEKRGTDVWRWAVIPDFGNFTHRESMLFRVHPAETWGDDKAWKEQKVQHQKGGSGRQRDHRPVYNGKVIGPQTQLYHIPIILKALVFMASIWARCEAGAPTQREEQYSIKLSRLKWRLSLYFGSSPMATKGLAEKTIRL